MYQPKYGTLAEVFLAEERDELNRGGKREGAGRPKLPAIQDNRNIRISDELWEWCKAQGKASTYIKGLIEADKKKKEGKKTE